VIDRNGQHDPWPRMMPLDLAAGYLGVSPENLRKQKNIAGLRRAGSKVLYDRAAFDRALDDCVDGADIWVALRRAAD
jgi:hypothetical protein